MRVVTDIRWNRETAQFEKRDCALYVDDVGAIRLGIETPWHLMEGGETMIAGSETSGWNLPELSPGTSCVIEDAK
jgi:hypothetical protein